MANTAFTSALPSLASRPDCPSLEGSLAMKSSFDFYGSMPPPLRPIDPARLLARRVEMGLNRAALAKRAGVSPRMIFFYEEGRHTPTPARLEQLAAALSCQVDDLTGAQRGQETLIDLRYAAGLTLERLADLLQASMAGRDLCVSAPKISALEKGLQVQGRHWQDSEVTGRLLAPLAKAYGVPVRMGPSRMAPPAQSPEVGQPLKDCLPEPPLA